MAKRWQDGATSASASKTVFVSTNLDTHLAMTLSYSDTVADFIRKIMLQHEQCIGAITVHQLKVPFQGKLYHLHESDMVVSNAFEGFEGRWSLFVDASSLLEDVKEQRALDPCDNGNLDSLRLPFADDYIAWKSPGKNILFTNDPRSKDDSMDQNKKLHSRNSYEARSGDDMKAMKKQKIKHSLQEAGPKVSTDSFVAAGPKVSISKISEQAERESNVIEKEEVYRHHLEDLSIRSQVSHMENLALEKYVTDRREDMASPNAPSQQVLGEQPAISARNKSKRKSKKKKLHQVTNSYVPSDNAATSELGTVLHGSVLQEACEGQILGSGNHGMVNDETMLTFTRNLQNDYKEGDVQLSSKHDMLLFENDKPSDLVETTPATKEIVICLGVDKYPEADNSEGSKSKIKKSRISTAHKQDLLDVEHDLSDPSKISVDVEDAVPRHIEDQSTRDEIVSPQNDLKKSEENSKLRNNHVAVPIFSGGSYKHLDSDDRNSNEKDSASDIAFNVRDDPEGSKSGCKPKKKKKKYASKSDYYVLERTKDVNDHLALKDSRSECISGDVMEEQMIVDDVNLPLTELNHIQSRNEDLKLNSEKEFNIDQNLVDQPDEEQKNKGTTKKKKKEIKSVKNSTGEDLGIQEVDPKNLGDEELASLVEKLCDGSEEKLTFDQSGVSDSGLAKNSDVKGTGKSEQVLENGEGPEVPAHEIESNFEVINATVVSMEKNNGLAFEGENSSVNLRRFLVPGDDHKEAVSTDKVEGESNVIEGANKAYEDKILPSKSLENQKNSHALSSSKAKQKTNVSEKTTSTSSRKKPKPLNSNSDVKIKALKKSKEQSVTDGSKEKNGSLTSSNLKSFSRDSKQIMINKSNQKSSQSQEKGLLTTPGVIFGDGLSESSGDENVKNLRSGSTTQSPSDSSSSSEDLMRGGSINKDRKGVKTTLCSKLADTKNMSINMIFRSSSRFKKAKLTASQSEAVDTNSQQVDFVPETQPI